MKRFLFLHFLIVFVLNAYGYDKTINLLTNGDFTNDLDGWETSCSASSSYTRIWVENGVCYLKAGTSGSSWTYYNCRISQTLKLQPGKYKCSFNYQGSFSEGGCCKIFRVISSKDNIIDTSDDYLINEVKNYSETFSSQYYFTITQEAYVMFLLSAQDHYGTIVSIKDCKLTRESIFIEPEAKSCTKEYGEENPNFDVIYNGVIPGDEEIVASSLLTEMKCEANKSSKVGSYPIKISCSGTADGYEVKKSKDGILTIETAPITVSCNDLEREYGDDNPVPDIYYTGFKNGESEDVITTKATYKINAVFTSDVGSYPIVLSSAKALNYHFEYKNAQMCIRKAPVTGIINNAERKYGDNNPLFTIIFEGLKNNESIPSWNISPSFTTEADRYSSVGVYSISIKECDAKNYDITRIDDGFLTINPAPLRIIANNKSRLYYEENPDLTFYCSGFKNGESETVLSEYPSVLTKAKLESNAGKYDINIVGGSAPNYVMSYQAGILTVNPRKLYVQVGDYERPYGEDNPDFKITYNGFVNDDNVGDLSAIPTASTSANKSSNAGSYTIYVSGGEAQNYTFDYTSGHLYIVKAEQEILWNQDLSNHVVGDQVELTARSSSGLPITYILTETSLCELYTTGTRQYLDCLMEGEVQIRAMQEGNSNYNPTTRISKTIKIAKKSESDGIMSVENSPILLYGSSNGIVAENVPPGVAVFFYTLDGSLVKRVESTGERIFIQLPLNKIYIAKVNGHTIKIRI